MYSAISSKILLPIGKEMEICSSEARNLTTAQINRECTILVKNQKDDTNGKKAS